MGKQVAASILRAPLEQMGSHAAPASAARASAGTHPVHRMVFFSRLWDKSQGTGDSHSSLPGAWPERQAFLRPVPDACPSHRQMAGDSTCHPRVPRGFRGPAV